MRQVRLRTFMAGMLVALLVGAGLGGWAVGRAETRAVRPAAPTIDAPIIPVQMPLNTGTFAKVARTFQSSS